jgi:hypothetical protein
MELEAILEGSIAPPETARGGNKYSRPTLHYRAGAGADFQGAVITPHRLCDLRPVSQIRQRLALVTTARAAGEDALAGYRCAQLAAARTFTQAAPAKRLMYFYFLVSKVKPQGTNIERVFLAILKVVW